MDFQVGNSNAVYLFALVAIAAILLIGAIVTRRRMWKRFAVNRYWNEFAPSISSFRSVISAFLLIAAMSCLVTALMDLRWGKSTRQVPQKGIEVIFALDVSRSMLAEDATPNRLQRAKQQISDMLNEMAGDRVGLVVFAGDAKQKVPLTRHHQDFRQTLDEVGPHSLPMGGSRLANALQASADSFISKTNDHKAIILFTDGEDQESDPGALAEKLNREKGIRVFTVGLGDFTTGSRIPIQESGRQQFLTHAGQQVWSKLNGSILKSIATRSEGAYIPAGTKQVNMGDVYHSFVSNVEQTEFEIATIDSYNPRFQWFAALSLLFLVLEVAWSTSIKTGSRIGNGGASSQNYANQAREQSRNRGGVHRNVAAFFVTILVAQHANAQSDVATARSINSANQLVREQKPVEAINEFSKIETNDSIQREKLNYNLAVAHYRNGDIPAANTLFTETAKSADREVAAASRHNLGNGHYALGLGLANKEPEKAIESFQRAVSFFRGSLRLNPDNADARANIELANEMMRQLKQNQQQKNPEQQQNQSPDNQKQDSKDQENSQSNPQSEPPSDQDNEKQESGSKSQQSSQEDKAREQQKNEESSDQSNSEAEADSTDSTEPTQGELTAQNQEPGQAPDRMIEGDSNRMMTREEAMKMLQSVRDRDLLRRLRKLRREQQRRVPVDRDW